MDPMSEADVGAGEPRYMYANRLTGLHRGSETLSDVAALVLCLSLFGLTNTISLFPAVADWPHLESPLLTKEGPAPPPWYIELPAEGHRFGATSPPTTAPST